MTKKITHNYAMECGWRNNKELARNFLWEVRAKWGLTPTAAKQLISAVAYTIKKNPDL